MSPSNTLPPLSVGLRHVERLFVAPIHTVPEIDDSWPGFREMPPVLATATMIAFIEQTCVQGLRPFLNPGQRTVGTHVDVSHVAATPVGMTVIAEIELIEVEGKSLLFKVTCRDDTGVIGEGTHQRTVIDVDRFMKRLGEKSAAAAASR
ncbi:fluoroacetyl-CoA thioesterase [Mycoplana sp. BE70]|uniref:thioesterase family protein n=1 Tax=Mycoplana sp. BE70 TaxID=2817775 RepID=UPI00285F7D8D|nr:thioesterase family protein [Mycoplana sp. BE70]MDR6756025.1 fluoroacetyl-CoA thioesterase [Mycoplana sp. BE70]